MQNGQFLEQSTEESEHALSDEKGLPYELSNIFYFQILIRHQGIDSNFNCTSNSVFFQDKTYDDILHRFQSVEKTIKTFVKNLSSYLENLNNYFIQLLIIIESIGEFYDVAHTPNRDLEYTKHAHRKISTEYYCDFRSSIENDVIKVLHKLQNKFAGLFRISFSPLIFAL